MYVSSLFLFLFYFWLTSIYASIQNLKRIKWKSQTILVSMKLYHHKNIYISKASEPFYITIQLSLSTRHQFQNPPLKSDTTLDLIHEWIWRNSPFISITLLGIDWTKLNAVLFYSFVGVFLFGLPKHMHGFPLQVAPLETVQ